MGNLQQESGMNPTSKQGGAFAALRERDTERDDRIAQARAMRDEGMTLQEIADVLGYKSASGVHKLLERGE